jgi:hypothetical protein
MQALGSPRTMVDVQRKLSPGAMVVVPEMPRSLALAAAASVAASKINIAEISSGFMVPSFT